PRAVRWESGFLRNLRDEFGEFLNLSKFASHAFARLPALVGDTQGTQPRRIRGDGVLARLVVSGNCWRSGLGLLGAQTCGAVGFDFQLSLLRGSEEVSVEKRFG